MKASIHFVDAEKTTRDQRWDAALGVELPRSCYRKVRSQEVPEGDPLSVCERVFQDMQNTRTPFEVAGERHRSMCVGDLVVIGDQRYLCDRVGFRQL